MKKVLVIPSIRESSLIEFFDTWHASGCADWDDCIVIEDNTNRTFDNVPSNCRHFSHKEIDSMMKSDSWIFSHKDSAIRCFGFYYAYKYLDADFIITLDDDVRPRGQFICAAHTQAMNGHPKWIPSIPGMRTRGLPYFNFGKLDVVMNMGLWSNVPDLDAVQTLAGNINATCFEPPKGSRIVPAGQYTPICGMNLAVAREAIPLCYFPPMGESQPYRRFDDIWMGIISKRIMDHLGWRLSVGDPSVEHIRASDPMKNLEKETPGILENETFWEAVDSIPLTSRDAPGCMTEIGEGLISHGQNVGHAYRESLGRAIVVWAGLFR